MKKILSLVLSLTLALALAVPAFADVLWEPGNRFYEKHAEECTLLQRSFTVNGEAGYIDLLDAPNASAVSLQLKNGETVYVYWQYQDWGYVETEAGGGWVMLDQLSLIYDHISFAEEYAASIVPHDAALCRPLVDSWDGGNLALWPYPGAPEPSMIWEDADAAMKTVQESGGATYFSQIFRDEEGLIWGFCTYLWGHRNFWVCLNAPAGREDPLLQDGSVTMPVREVPAVELTPPQEPVMPRSYLLPMALVAGAVALSGAALLVMKKKKR